MVNLLDYWQVAIYNPPKKESRMSDAKELDNWLSVSEASEFSGYGMDWLRELVKDRKVIGIKKGHMILIDRKSLEEYKANEDKKTQVN